MGVSPKASLCPVSIRSIFHEMFFSISFTSLTNPLEGSIEDRIVSLGYWWAAELFTVQHNPRY